MRERPLTSRVHLHYMMGRMKARLAKPLLLDIRTW